MSTLKYRADIDGMRAIAVLSVVAYHLNPAWLPGGFLGVDMFFVISGFLITSIVRKGTADSTFSFANFYKSRIKRLVPALTVVLLATLAVGHQLLLPSDLDRLAESALASQLFVANVYFTYALDTSYFANEAKYEPLLHLWSLGVEEQFYAIWPLLLVFFSRRLNTIFLGVLILLGIASSVWFGQVYAHSNPSFAYYMLPGRVAELLLGAFISLLIGWRLFNNSLVSQLACWVGISLIAYSVIYLDSTTVFPGLNALPVSIGTALLILGGRISHVVTRGLSLAPMVSVGLISYSLYLWHWPIVSVTKYLFGSPGIALSMALFALMLLLAWATYRWVETPCRQVDWELNKVLSHQFLFPTVIVGFVSVAFMGTSGLGLHYWSGDYAKQLSEMSHHLRKAPKSSYICQRTPLTKEVLTKPECIIGSDQSPGILVWGDSHASHYVPALRELAIGYGFSFRNIQHGACPSLLNSPSRFTFESARPACDISSELALTAIGDYETIILSNNWTSYVKVRGQPFVNELKSTVAELERRGVRVIVIGPLSRFRDYDRACALKSLKVGALDCTKAGTVGRAGVAEISSTIRETVVSAGAEYLDFNPVFCDSEICFSSLHGRPVYYDPAHLSEGGSRSLGQELLRRSAYSEIFESLARDPASAAAGLE